jgi:ABC-2 type transport system permease protein
MFKQIGAMTWKELKIYLKDPAVWAWLFLQPFVLIVALSFAMGGSLGDDPEAEEAIPILAVNEDQGTQGAMVLDRLDGMETLSLETTWNSQPLTREQAERLIVEGERDLALVIPAGFSQIVEADTASGAETVIVAISDPGFPNEVVEPVLASLQGFALAAAMTEGLSESATLPAAIRVEHVAPSGMQAEQIPTAFQYNVPGITIYGIFWIVSLLAGSVYREKREGTFRRLLVAPMTRSTMLAGKVLPYYLINLLQITAMLGLSRLLFGIDLGTSPAGLVLVSLAAAATATGLGVLVAALARTDAQVGAISTILLITLAVLGGCFVPRWVMPEWLQTLGLLTPHAWAVDAYQALMVQGAGLAQVLPAVVVLAAFAAVFFGLGVWRFRFE